MMKSRTRLFVPLMLVVGLLAATPNFVAAQDFLTNGWTPYDPFDGNARDAGNQLPTASIA